MAVSKVAMLAAVALGLGACTLGARDVDYSRDRGISDDISAVYNNGPTALQPGKQARDEPVGAYPWEIGARHQPGR